MEKYRHPVIKSSGNCVGGSAFAGGGFSEKYKPRVILIASWLGKSRLEVVKNGLCIRV
jgi:hypothetical protein